MRAAARIVAPGIAFAVLALSAFAIALTVQRSSPGSFDFVALYASARLVATGQGDLVTDPSAILAMEHAAAPERTALLNNPNPPAVSLLLAPLGLLPFGTAYLVMLGLSTCALSAALLLLGPLAAPESRARLLAVAMLAPPSLVALAQGQTTPFVLLAVVASRRGVDPLASGLLLAATALRPQIAPLYLLAAATDRRRLAGFGIGVLAVAAVSLFATGLDGMARYPDLVRAAAGEGGRNELGLGTLVRRLGITGFDPVALNLAVSALVLVVGAIVAWRARDRVVAAGPWALLGAPHALLHDAVFAYPAVAATRGPAAAAWIATGFGASLAAVALPEPGWSLVTPWLAALAIAGARRR